MRRLDRTTRDGSISIGFALICLLAFLTAILPASAKSVASSKAREKTSASAESDAEADISENYESVAPTHPPKIAGKLGILVDTRTGKILWGKNPHLRRPMASLTKVMTALLILKSGRLDDVVTASVNANKTHDSSMYLAVGEKVTLRDLLWAILLRSANDACIAAAEHLGGSVHKFVAKMNREARRLGLKDTHFVTPNGLYAPGHYSTPADLAKITLEDMKYPLFNEMVKTKRHVIQRSIRKGNAVMISRSRILWKWPLADGVKTGYVRQAGHCFIGSATKDGWRLLSVVMNSPHVGDDTRALLEYGFARFRSVKLGTGGRPLASVKVTGSATKSVPVGLAKDFYDVVPRGAEYPGRPKITDLSESLSAPVKRGDPAGKLDWTQEDRVSASADLVALKSAEPPPVVQRSGWLPMLAILLLAVGVFKYGASSKNYRKRRHNVKKRGRAVGR